MTHKFLPPASVNYSKPFRFVLDYDQEGTIFSCDVFHNAQVTINWAGKEHPCTYEGSAIKGFIRRGDWLVIDETPEMPSGESFQFKCNGLSQVYLALKVGEDMRVPIRWTDEKGFSHSTDYGVEVVRKHIESGAWTVLPSEPTQTAEQSSENAFKALEDVVRNHKQLNMENGSTIVFATGEEEEAWESSNNASDTLLDTIKAFTQDGLFHVALSEGIYKVYCYNAEYSVTTDKQLVEVMKALEILEGCLGD